MDTDATKTELNEALAVITPEIRGLHDLEVVSISPSLQEDVRNQASDREHRRDLINAVLNDITALEESWAELEADGYPTLDTLPLTVAEWDELQLQIKDLEDAASTFTQDIGAKIDVNLGAPVDDK
jgi:hypothetical protein